jgi:hypothetical protein
LAAGTPALAVSYFGPKAYGIMAQFEMTKLCLDISRFSADEAFERLNALRIDDIRRELNAKIGTIRNDLIHITSQILRKRDDYLLKASSVPTLRP